MELLVSPTSLEPGIFGIVKPVLVWPAGISSHLEDAHLEAILAHEVWHVRRRDNLAAAIHMVVQAIFWFHPLVWWLGARLVEERERACDEEVLELGSERQVYAESILKTCEFCVESPLACVSGVTGADLKKRIVRIMTERLAHKLSFGRKVLLAATGMAAIAGPLVFGLMNAPQIRGQSAQITDVPEWQILAGGKNEFEVATVKPSKPGTPFGSSVSLDAAEGPPVGSLFRANAPLMAYLLFAYKISDSNQARSIYDKLPAWAKAPQFFHIEGRAEGNPTRDQLRLMVQALLADRFKLVIHREMQPRQAYALVLDKPGKLGRNLKPHPADKPCVNNPSRPVTIQVPTEGAEAPHYCGMARWSIGGELQLQIIDMDMAQIANYLASESVLANGMLVPHSGIDATGLTGRFDLQFHFVPEPGGVGSNLDVPGPRYSESLKKQLGLRFVERKTAVEIIVIDHLEKPSLEN